MINHVRRRYTGFSAALLAFVIVPGGAQMASATGTQDDPVLDALAIVAPEVLDNVISEAATGAGGDPQVDIPAKVTDPISISSSDGRHVALNLPDTGEVGRGDAIADGIVSFDNGDGSYSAPIVKEGGSVQVTTVISSSDAPTRYDYSLTIPEGASVALEDGGTVIVRDAQGRYIAGILPAWAKDVDGSAIPTHYEVANNTVTQVIEHSADTRYPVVADPWLGIDLFQATYYNRVGTYQSKNTTPGLMSLYAQQGYYNPVSTGIWAEIMRTAGWSELTTKRPLGITTGTLYPSIRQQYDCHVVYGRAVWLSGLHWDMEHARPNFPTWPASALSHHCNW